MVVHLYVEGGGEAARLKRKCREGFARFFEKADFGGRMPRITASGSRGQAYGDFCIAVKNATPDIFPILLVDSEAPVSDRPWTHLRNRPGDGWTKPSNASDDQAHLMVQCMESWFLADRDWLRQFYGQFLHLGSLPGNPNIEDIPKSDVLSGLENATCNAVPQGRYSKGNHSFEILAGIDPDKVRKASRHADNLIGVMDKTAG